MYCPVCSQEQIGLETRFCSRCGFPLTGVSHLISNNGELPQMFAGKDSNAVTARKRGVKQGAVLLLLGAIIVPLIGIIAVASHSEPWFMILIAVLTFWGGILRMLYAALFESKTAPAENESIIPAFLGKRLSSKKAKELPPAQSIPVSTYVPPKTPDWRNTTNDLVAPPSVTDETTKFLTKTE